MPIPLRKSRKAHPNCDEFNDYLDRGKNVVGSIWKCRIRKVWTVTILLTPVPADKINEHATVARRLGKDYPTQEDAEYALWKEYRMRQRKIAAQIARENSLAILREFPVAINSEVDL